MSCRRLENLLRLVEKCRTLLSVFNGTARHVSVWQNKEPDAWHLINIHERLKLVGRIGSVLIERRLSHIA